jgi:hypothetical protein
MNALVKKEIRLLLPAWIAAVLLAMVQGITRPYDFYVASLLFFGLTLMALTVIGRETSLNTFSLLLSQPAERLRLWKVKLTVLAIAFVIVLLVWLAAFGIAFVNSRVDESDRENSYNLFITICLIAAATFSGGLWTTLLLRQVAGAFWLTLLVPATLSGFSGVFLVNSDSSSLVIAVLSVVIGVYSIAGFLFARWLFFRAQDVGWSGGVISMPEWKWLAARADNAVSVRTRKPVSALIKKELQLHQISLLGAAGLLVLHVGVIVFRSVHHFQKDSAGEVLTAIFWMTWLVMAPVIGSMAVAEERRLGVMDAQLCLPFSRRAQFVIKACVTLFLATFLGGVMPVLLEEIAGHMSGGRSVFTEPAQGYLWAAIVAVGAWLALASFFASTLAKSFLQAAGFAVATFFCCAFMVPLFTQGHLMLFVDSNSGLGPRLLPFIIAVPTIIVALLWLAYLNFANFREGWTLWRRNVSGVAVALLFIFVGSNAVYYRAWDIFEPAEPAHGPAKLTLANPPVFTTDGYRNVLVRLPDGRVWFDYLAGSGVGDQASWWSKLRSSIAPLPVSIGPRQFLSGSNWVNAAAHRFDFGYNASTNGIEKHIFVSGFSDSVGIQRDGTLWVSDKSSPTNWTAQNLTQFGDETDWQQMAASSYTVLLLKKNGTLWEWGPVSLEVQSALRNWPGLRTFQPRQIGTNSDWDEISANGWGFHGGRTDGTVWAISFDKSAHDILSRLTNFESIPFREGFSAYGKSSGAYVRNNGTLWIYHEVREHGRSEFKTWQSNSETNWVAVARGWEWMAALKSDGTLWQWNENGWADQPKFTMPPTRVGIHVVIHMESIDGGMPPTRVGIHSDWVALAGFSGGAIALAGDGSLWFWPDRDGYKYSYYLLALPKQPQFLGNVLKAAN